WLMRQVAVKAERGRSCTERFLVTDRVTTGRRAGASFRLALSLVMLPLSFLLTASSAHATIRYDVRLSRPAEHTFHVTMHIPDVRGSVTVQMAAWDALYQIRDFAHHISDMHWVDGSGKALPLVRSDKQTWRITATGEVRVDYSTFWDESGP